MRDAYEVAAVRAAERSLMELVPEGTLMGRAATGLAAVCASLLRQQPGHVYGTRVVVLAGSGDNGGDNRIGFGRIRQGGFNNRVRYNRIFDDLFLCDFFGLGGHRR